MIPFVHLHGATNSSDEILSMNVNNIVYYTNGTTKNYSTNTQIPCCIISCLGDCVFYVKENASQVLLLIKNSQKEN